MIFFVRYDIWDNISCILNSAIDSLVESNQVGDHNRYKIVLVDNSNTEEISAKAWEDNMQGRSAHTYL